MSIPALLTTSFFPAPQLQMKIGRHLQSPFVSLPGLSRSLKTFDLTNITTTGDGDQEMAPNKLSISPSPLADFNAGMQRQLTPTTHDADLFT